MRLERVVNNRDAEDEVFVANNMEELHQAVMRNLNKSVGHEVKWMLQSKRYDKIL
jgi:hypothetical protein